MFRYVSFLVIPFKKYKQGKDRNVITFQSSVYDFYDFSEPKFPQRDVNSTSWVIVRIKRGIHFMFGAI